MWKTLSIQQENKNERWKRQRQNGICQVGCERDWEKVEKEEEEKKKKVETVQGMWIKSGARIEGVKKKGKRSILHCNVSLLITKSLYSKDILILLFYSRECNQ